MKKLLTCSVVILLALWGVCVLGATLPKFAGNWVLHREKSSGLTGGLADAEVRLVVTQDNKQLTAEQKVLIRGREQPSQELIYKLDGSPTSVEVVRPLAGTMNLKAKWLEASHTLELIATISGEADGKETTLTTKEQWQIVEGGKALRVLRTRETPQGTQHFKLYFTRDE